MSNTEQLSEAPLPIPSGDAAEASACGADSILTPSPVESSAAPVEPVPGAIPGWVNPVRDVALSARNRFQDAVCMAIDELLAFNRENAYLAGVVARVTHVREFRTLRITSHRRAGHTYAVPKIVERYFSDRPVALIVEDVSNALYEPELWAEAYPLVKVYSSAQVRADDFVPIKCEAVICDGCVPPKWAYDDSRQLVLVLGA